MEEVQELLEAAEDTEVEVAAAEVMEVHLRVDTKVVAAAAATTRVATEEARVATEVAADTTRAAAIKADRVDTTKVVDSANPVHTSNEANEAREEDGRSGASFMP